MDFSDAGKAVSRFLANRNRRLFTISTENALVTLLREGVSINEASVDSKRDLEEALRTACNDFIDHTCKVVAGDVLTMVEQLQSNNDESKTKSALLQPDSVKKTLTATSDKVQETCTEVTTQMALYLDNAATQSILLKPITKKIVKGLSEIRNFTSEVELGINGWDETSRGEVFLLLDEVEKKLKAALKSTK